MRDHCQPSSFTRFHQGLVRCKYQWLYSSGKRTRPGPKGPSKEVVAAVVEMKRRNPRFGCPKIAEQIAQAFGIVFDKDTVRRVLAKHYRPDVNGGGICWLTAIGHAKDSLWSIDLFRCESILLQSFWVMVVIDVFTRRIIGFGVKRGDIVPFVPQSHPFVERVIGTLRREYLDHLFFWNGPDLERKLLFYRDYYNQHRCHSGLRGQTPNGYGAEKAAPTAMLESYRWLSYCRGMFQLPAAA